MQKIIPTMTNLLVEFRTYKLRAGEGVAFHHIMGNESVPLLIAAGTSVIGYGNSAGDNDAYVLIRAYTSEQDRKTSQEAFYSSDVWRNGPRNSIISRIDTSIDFLRWMTRQQLSALISHLAVAEIR